MTERKAFKRSEQLEVWYRDAWHCRYCLEPVFFSPALKVLEELGPGHSYYHGNGKTGAMIPLFQWTWASVDHVLAVTLGGSNDPENLVTACWRCNLTKGGKSSSDFSPVRPIPSEQKALNWDGFAAVYAALLPQNDEWSRLIDGRESSTESAVEHRPESESLERSEQHASSAAENKDGQLEPEFFATSLDPDAPRMFVEWQRANPDGYLVNVKSQSKGMLHRVGCPHIGKSEEWVPEWGDLTDRLKVCHPKPDPLHRWAEAQGCALDRCSSCKS